MLRFIPEDYGFFSEPQLFIEFDSEKQKFHIGDYGSKVVDKVSPGVYAWTVKEGDEIFPLYIGLYGARAENPSLRKRFEQHKNGLRGSLQGKAPTPHWENKLFPEAMKILEHDGKKIEIYFGMFAKNEIAELEIRLINKFDTPWNAQR